MADITLTKPEAGAAQNIPSNQDGAYIFDFSQEDVETLNQVGDNLQISLKDGSTINIENYYTTHNADNPPVFMIEGEPVAEQTFFENFDKADITTAAGGTGAGTATRGGRYNEYGTSDLDGGVDHLTRLDYNSDRAFEFENSDWITSPDEEGEEPGIAESVNNPITDAAGNSTILTIGIEKPVEPNGQTIRVWEKGLLSKTDIADIADIAIPDGYSIKEGEYFGAHGTISQVDGKWVYTLTESINSKDVPGPNKIAEGDQVNITLVDGNGNEFTVPVTVDIWDDVPVINLNENITRESSHSYQLHGSGSFSFGADSFSTYDNDESQDSRGITLTLTKGDAVQQGVAGNYENGSYVFNLEDGAKVILTPSADQTGEFEFVYDTNCKALNNTEADLDYTFNFTIKDADGDTASASATHTVPPTNLILAPDPEEPTIDDSDPQPDPFEPGHPSNPENPDTQVYEDVDNIIIGSTAQTLPAEIVYNMAFLYDLAGDSSVKYIGMEPDDITNAPLYYQNMGYYEDDSVAQQAQWHDDIKEPIAFISNGDHYFRGKGGELYNYEDLYQSMQKTIEYIKGAYDEIKPGTTINVLMGGFDIKIEAACEFTISCDQNWNKSITCTQFTSQTPRLDYKGMLAEPKLSGDGVLESCYAQPESPPEGKDVNEWLNDIFKGFKQNVIYNLNTAFSEGDCGYLYATTNIDNALGLATGWFEGKAETSNNSGMEVINKTFLISDGGAQTHTEPIDKILHYYNNYRGGAGNNFYYDVNSIKDYWVVEDENGHWASKDSGFNPALVTWDTIDWKPGRFAVVKVAGGTDGECSNDYYLVINQLGLVMGLRALPKEGSLGEASQLKWTNGNCSDGEYWNQSVPVVMDWIENENGEKYFVPCLANPTTKDINYNGPFPDTTINNIDKDARVATKETADQLKDVSEITVIRFGNHEIGDLKDYASAVDNNPNDNIIDVGDWKYLPDQIKASLPKPANDIMAGNKGDDILFGDSLGLPAKQLGEDDLYNRDLAEQANVAALGAILSDMDLKINPKTDPAEAAAVIWNNSDKIAESLDHKDGLVGGSDTIIGGDDNDVLFGMGGNDLLIGDGSMGTRNEIGEIFLNDAGRPPNAKAITDAYNNMEFTVQRELDTKIETLENHEDSNGGNDKLYGGDGNDVLLGMEGNDKLIGGAGDDLLFGGSGDDFLDGGEGNDALYGGSGDDLLFGGSGDDFLDGGEGKDALYGGSGNELIVFDDSDYLIDGGSGLDIILAGHTDFTLQGMLENFANVGKPEHDENMPMVNDVEVMIKGVDVASLTSMDDLAKQYGIRIGKDANGNDSLSLDKSKGWEAGNDNTFINTTNHISIETSNMDITDGGNTEMITLQRQVESEGGGI